MMTQKMSCVVAFVLGTAALGFGVPAKAEWGGGYGGTPMPSGGVSSCVPGATNCKASNGRPMPRPRPSKVEPGDWNQGSGGSRPRPGSWDQGGGYGGGNGGRPPEGWNQGEYGGGMRPCRRGSCGDRPTQWGSDLPSGYPGYPGNGGYRPTSYEYPRPTVCYNFAGRPYLYRGRGRCPIS
jgi:hypothetical protein